MTKQIGKGKAVRLRYVMRGPEGGVLDETTADGEGYIHGAANIVPGLERALDGRREGDRFEVTLAPADAFGSRKRGGPGPQPVPRATFPHGATLSVGMSFSAETPGGAPVKLYIARIERETIFVDQQHPYAGKTVTYEVEVVEVRDATADEQSSGVFAT